MRSGNCYRHIRGPRETVVPCPAAGIWCFVRIAESATGLEPFPMYCHTHVLGMLATVRPGEQLLLERTT